MRILITGGCGFVGRAMIRHIREYYADSTITVIDDLSEDKETFYKQGLDKLVDHSYIPFDVTTLNFYTWARRWRFNLCIHCAAVIKGKKFQVSSPLGVAKNLAIDQAVISAVSRGLADELCYFSSCAAYSTLTQDTIIGNDLPYKFRPNFESQLEMNKFALPIYPPEGIYGWCKIMGEVLCSQLVDKKVTILRPFGGYGTDQALTYPFPAIVERVKRGDDPITVWGSGKQVRDWIHVRDICRLTFDAHNKGAGVVNLGTGVGTDFTQLAIQIIMKAGRGELILRNDPSKPEGVKYRVADTLKMQKLRLFPEISLSQGIEMALRGEI